MSDPSHLPNDWSFFSTCNFAELNFYLFDGNYLWKRDRVLVLKFICECNLNFLFLVQPKSKEKKNVLKDVKNGEVEMKYLIKYHVIKINKSVSKLHNKQSNM